VSSAPTDVTAQAAPGASYNGSGSWHFNVTETVGESVFTDEGNVTFTQNQSADLHATIDNTEITLTRQGSGRKISYKMSTFEAHTNCNAEFSGHASIDTSTNTLEAKLRGTEQECQRAEVPHGHEKPELRTHLLGRGMVTRSRSGSTGADR